MQFELTLAMPEHVDARDHPQAYERTIGLPTTLITPDGPLTGIVTAFDVAPDGREVAYTVTALPGMVEPVGTPNVIRAL